MTQPATAIPDTRPAHPFARAPFGATFLPPRALRVYRWLNELAHSPAFAQDPALDEAFRAKCAQLSPLICLEPYISYENYYAIRRCLYNIFSKAFMWSHSTEVVEDASTPEWKKAQYRAKRDKARAKCIAHIRACDVDTVRNGARAAFEEEYSRTPIMERIHACVDLLELIHVVNPHFLLHHYWHPEDREPTTDSIIAKGKSLLAKAKQPIVGFVNVIEHNYEASVLAKCIDHLPVLASDPDLAMRQNLWPESIDQSYPPAPGLKLLLELFAEQELRRRTQVLAKAFLRISHPKSKGKSLWHPLPRDIRHRIATMALGARRV